MGARPLRRAIQRYIEDPLADEVLSQTHAARLDRRGRQGAGGRREREVSISIVKPAKVREAVGVGAKGGAIEEGSDEPRARPATARRTCRTSPRSCRTCRTPLLPKRSSRTSIWLYLNGGGQPPFRFL